MTFADAIGIVAPLRAQYPFVEGCDERTYHADPCPLPSFSASLGKVILDKSPLHAYLAHPRLGGKKRDEPSAAMDFGTLVHKLVLGCGKSVVAVNADDWRTKAAKDQRDEARAAGKLAVLSRDLDSAVECECAFRTQLHAMAPDLEAKFNRGQKERVIAREFANLKGEGRAWARGMLDCIDVDWDDRREIVICDVKTTADASVDSLIRRVSSMHYDMQLATYEWLAEEAFPAFKGRIRSYLLFVETVAPFSLVPVELDSSYRQIGRSKLGRAWDAWCSGMATGVWPSYADNVVTISPPPYEVSRELDEEIRVA